ncbi:hypothetical protein Q7P37_008094 [Cladosporium fusiforme]
MSVVINRSEAAGVGSGLSKLPSPPKPRVYGDGPLPIQASDIAPRNARIINRVFEDGKVAFELKIGETVLEDVGLDEVLEYVSAYHLEEYENKKFKEEEELQRIADEEDQRLMEEEHARHKERAKRKGVVFMEERSEDDDEDAMDTEMATGKHGRARPSYKKLFKKFKQRRRRRKRDPATGELMSRSEDDDDGLVETTAQQSSSDEQFQDDKVKQRRRRRKRDPATGELMPLSEDGGDDKLENTGQRSSSGEARQGGVPLDNMGLPKRRRRKRDPVTNELIPLPSEPGVPPTNRSRYDDPRKERPPSPLRVFEKPKRNRRRRHPVTKELMPLGWVYDAEAEQRGRQEVPPIQRLSLSKHNEPKRRRLESSSPHHRSGLAVRPGPTIAPVSAFKQGDVIHLDDSDSETSAEEAIQFSHTPKPKLLRRSVGGAPIVAIPSDREVGLSPGRSNATLPVRTTPSISSRARLPSVRSDSSIIPLEVEDQILSSEEDEDRPAPAPSAPITSIAHPSAGVGKSSSSESGSESEDEDLPDDEFFVEAILTHAWSSPQTHPPEFGKKPVMLYKVKWEGFADPTWEPKSSFDADVLSDYQKSAGMTEHEING